MELLLLVPVGIVAILGIALMGLLMEIFVYGGMIVLAVAFVVEILKFLF